METRSVLSTRWIAAAIVAASFERVRRREQRSARLYRRGQGTAGRPHRAVAARRAGSEFRLRARRAPLPVHAGRPRSGASATIRTPSRARIAIGRASFSSNFRSTRCAMVGTLADRRASFGLVQTTDGLVHRVTVGNHMGQNYGRITAISDSEIQLVEIISDGLGGYLERPAAIGSVGLKRRGA